MNLNESFWSEKYLRNKTGWDIGYVSTPIKEYIDQLEDKNLKILIPGGGNSYEAEYLFEQGFSNVFVADISKIPLSNLLSRNPKFPENQLLHIDFFNVKDTFDLIFEQTFFCALPPEKRPDYVEKMHQLLTKNGKLVGLLFDMKLNEDHPPFGGSKTEYETLFSPFFRIEKMEPAYNSIKPRAGKELFVSLRKKEF